MTIDQVYRTVLFILNRVQAGNTSPARFNLAVSLANVSLFKRYSGVPEEYQPGAPVSKMAFSITGEIEKVQRLFKETVTLYIDSETGFATVPTAFQKESTVTWFSQRNGKTVAIEVDICNDVEFQEKLTSYLVPADLDNPACVFKKQIIEFAPKTLVNAQLVYLRMPVTPVWAFTVVSNRPVYDPNTSVDPEWPDTVINDFIVRICQFLGYNLQRTELIQQMEVLKQQGN